LYRAGRFPEAIGLLTENLRKPRGSRGPDPVTEWLFLAMAEHRLGHAEAANKWLAKAVSAVDEPRARTNRPRARPDLASRADPAASWYRRLGLKVLRQEAEQLDLRDRRAESGLDRAVQASPQDPAPLLARGRFRANRGRWQEAAADFDCALALRPPDAGLLLARARFQVQRGCPARAAADYDRAARLRPNDADWQRQCGRAQAGLGRWEAAARTLARAVGLRPADETLRLEWAETQAWLGHWRAAIKEWGRAAELHPDDPEAWYNLALANLGADRRPRYRELCEEMMRRFGPGPGVAPHVRVFWACLPMPDAVHDQGVRLEQALGTPESDAGDTVLGTDRGFLLESAWPVLAYRAGKLEAALQRLQEKTDETRRYWLPGPRPWHLLFLAMTQRRIGQAEAARQSLARANRWIATAERAEGGDHAGPGPHWEDWRERVITRTLRYEVERVLGEKR
jgi:tetratricopeptide (TPR) repeat protein